MDERQIARALAAAGTRPEAPAQVAAQVHAALERAWVADLAQRRHRQRMRWAIAAMLLLAAGGTLWLQMNRQAPRADAGIYVASRGAVDISGDGGDAHAGRVVAVGGSALPAGTLIRTGHDGFALLAVGSVSLRIGPDSEARLERADRLRLARGRIYLDSGTRGAAQDLRLLTSLGTLQHVGTQFQATVEAQRLSILVREGRVRLTTAATKQLIEEREAAEVDAGGNAHVYAAPAYGVAWDWISELHPDMPIEGLPLTEFLAWFARETGQRIEYDSPATRAAAQATRLSGSIAGLSPQQALSAVLASTQFLAESAPDGVLRLKARPATHAKLHADAVDELAGRSVNQRAARNPGFVGDRSGARGGAAGRFPPSGAARIPGARPATDLVLAAGARRTDRSHRTPRRLAGTAVALPAGTTGS